MTGDKYTGGGTRWTPGRKAELVKAVASGTLTIEQVCAQYGISKEEFAQWHWLHARDGKRALSTTQAQTYRGRTRPKRPYRRRK